MKEYYEPIMDLVILDCRDIITASTDDNIVDPYE